MFEEIVKEFAELNLQIIKDIKSRGYSHADIETLEAVRENMLALKDMGIKLIKSEVKQTL